MRDAELTSRVKHVIQSQLGVDEKDINLNSVISTDLGADTLDTVELIIGLEEEFDITLPEDECESVNTVGDLIELTKKHIKDRF